MNPLDTLEQATKKNNKLPRNIGQITGLHHSKWINSICAPETIYSIWIHSINGTEKAYSETSYGSTSNRTSTEHSFYTEYLNHLNPVPVPLRPSSIFLPSPVPSTLTRTLSK